MFSIADADPQVACCILLCAIVLPLILSFTSCMLHIARVGQNRIYAPYMTVYLVISPPKIPYIHRIYIYAFGQPYILLCAKKYFPSFFHSRVACCILLCAKGTSPHSFIHKLHVAYCCVQTSTSPLIHELHVSATLLLSNAELLHPLRAGPKMLVSKDSTRDGKLLRWRLKLEGQKDSRIY